MATVAMPALDARAEAFRAEIAADRQSAGSAFDDWRRSQRGGRWGIMAVRAATFSPGLISFMLSAPVWFSIGLSVAALVGNLWIRATRRQRMRDIVAWQEPDELG